MLRKKDMSGKPRIQIDFNKIYESNSCGPFKIIENLGRDSNHRLFVKVKFINTGTERIVRYDRVQSGEIYDELFGIEFNRVFYSLNYGPYYIVDYAGKRPIAGRTKRFVSIRFLNTGFEYDVEIDSARFGNVKDYSLDPQECGIKKEDFDNDIEYNEIIKKILKSRWTNIMARCYNPKDTTYYNYGALGVTVCEYWHTFNNFLESVVNIPYYTKFYHNPYKYHLDKDYLQQNIPVSQRVYSPQTCMFLSIIDNSNLAIFMNHPANKYFGIEQTECGNYTVELTINGKLRNLGTYTNLTAAVNIYNKCYLKYSEFELIPLLNNGFQEMSIEDALKFKV
ncbi:MAG: hypothetical protein IKR19_09080 [Acholeplasmatales bacterium]|nr:hypothetical protein [Acholeplasmatales bacterium]